VATTMASPLHPEGPAGLAQGTTTALTIEPTEQITVPLTVATLQGPLPRLRSPRR
jgi:hypothetical protein